MNEQSSLRDMLRAFADLVRMDAFGSQDGSTIPHHHLISGSATMTTSEARETRHLAPADLVPTSRDSTAINWMIGLARAHGLRAAVWNPLRGCRRAGTACRSCWAAAVAWRRARHPSAAIAARHAGLTVLGTDGLPRFNGHRRAIEEHMRLPLERPSPTLFFAMSEGDLWLADHPADDVQSVLENIGAAEDADRGHVFLLLTKRPEQMASHLLSGAAADAWNLRRLGPRRWPAPNMIVGTSIWDAAAADAAHPHMARLAMNGWRTFVSYEPSLGPVDWSGWEFLSWLIAGGEAGPSSRPSHPSWHDTAARFALEHGIPFFGKQPGDWVPSDNGGDRGSNVVWLHPSGGMGSGAAPGLTRMRRVGKTRAGLPLFDGGAPLLQVPFWPTWLQGAAGATLAPTRR